MVETRVVITFQTTTHAIAWERACKEEGLPGRLIPMPVEISAHCGLAWLAAPDTVDILLERARELDLSYDRVVELK
ncbi:MAG TPA: DUF3343 domain-containing protein [Firmicutes bacterium]|jgi:hypothetical protein|nr:DUF3343 domain-containing protein [Bacillota bacterium]HHT43540.1 DUF3343 domain-containing protein [Bacillota bacterium]